MTRLSQRIDASARIFAARINAGALACTDPEQTADLRALTCAMLGWAAESAALEDAAIARIVATGRGALAARSTPS